MVIRSIRPSEAWWPAYRVVSAEDGLLTCSREEHTSAFAAAPAVVQMWDRRVTGRRSTSITVAALEADLAEMRGRFGTGGKP